MPSYFGAGFELLKMRAKKYLFRVKKSKFRKIMYFICFSVKNYKK